MAFAPFTPGAPFTLGSFVPTGNILADTLRVGSATTGTITVSGTFNLSGINTLDLRSGADIVETSGASLQVPTLTGQARSATLNGPNQIGMLGDFKTTSGFALNNTQSLTVAGQVQGGSQVTLNVAGDLAIQNLIQGNTVTLIAAGAISETGNGRVTAGTLTGSADTATLDGLHNQLSTLGAFTTNAGFVLTTGDPFPGAPRS